MRNGLAVYAAVALLCCCAALSGCSNASREEYNSKSGSVVLYDVSGEVIFSTRIVGKPVMCEGGHLYFRDAGTGELVIVYGTYVFKED